MKSFNLFKKIEVGFFVRLFYILGFFFPIILSFIVTAVFDRNFSSQAIYVQHKNLKEISLILFLSFFVAFFFASYLRKNLTFLKATKFLLTKSIKLNPNKNLFLYFLGSFYIFGLLKSFGMKSIFDSHYIYTGAKIAWLGYGAWGISLNIIIATYFAKSVIDNKNLFLDFIKVILIYIPILLSGTRIDFLSIYLALLAFLFFIKKNLIYSILFFITLYFILKITGIFRYPESIDPLFPNLNIINGRNNFYLGTFGDIGLSLWQIIDFSYNSEFKPYGFFAMIENYSLRMLPGPLFQSRPGDFMITSGFALGGGAINSIAESYIFLGFFGFILPSLISGFLAAIAERSYSIFNDYRNFISLFIFLFIWVILPKGGWYQFFSIFKSIEVMMFIMLIIAIVENKDKWKNF